MTETAPEAPPVYTGPDDDPDNPREPDVVDLLVDLAGQVLSGDHYQAFRAKAAAIRDKAAAIQAGGPKAAEAPTGKSSTASA
jgi:hypothetical protein